MEESNAAITKSLFEEEEAFRRFRRGLRRRDQLVLDDLTQMAKQHVAAAAVVTHATPFEMLLLALLLEEHKAVMRLRVLAERLQGTADLDQI